MHDANNYPGDWVAHVRVILLLHLCSYSNISSACQSRVPHDLPVDSSVTVTRSVNLSDTVLLMRLNIKTCVPTRRAV